MNTSEIAKLAHVSRTTVSRVLNGHPNVSEKTRQRVESIVNEYHFFPMPQRGTLLESRARYSAFLL